MSTRTRMSWSGKSAAGVVLPIEAAAKKGSAHPQTPDEGITHPAGYPDPTQPDAYENGDTSSWAEDVHEGPYRTSLAPANPMDDGGYRHPAAQPGAPGKNASRNMIAAAERKAAQCLRIAEALLGPDVSTAAAQSDNIAIAMLEDQALDFMHLSDDSITATLRRLEAATVDEETLLRKMLASDEGTEDEDSEESEMASKKARARRVAEEEEEEAEVASKKARRQREAARARRAAEEETEDEDSEESEVASKKAARARRANDPRMAEVMSMLSSIQAELAALKGGKSAEMDEDAMLAEMLAEESAPATAESDVDAEADAMLAEMLNAESAVEAEEEPAVAGKTLADYMDVEDDMEFDMDMGQVEDGDPMGVYEDDGLLDDGDELLASIFASDESKSEDTEDEESEEEAAPKSAAARTAAARARTAALRPQPKKPTVGAKTVGTQVRTASNDRDELSKLWGSAPDVSKIFGN